MHASKKGSFEQFFENKKETCCSKKLRKVKVKKMSPRRRRSRK